MDLVFLYLGLTWNCILDWH